MQTLNLSHTYNHNIFLMVLLTKYMTASMGFKRELGCLTLVKGLDRISDINKWKILHIHRLKAINDSISPPVPCRGDMPSVWLYRPFPGNSLLLLGMSKPPLPCPYQGPGALPAHPSGDLLILTFTFPVGCLQGLVPLAVPLPPRSFPLSPCY